MKRFRGLGANEEIERQDRSVFDGVGYSKGNPNTPPKDKTEFTEVNNGRTFGVVVNIVAQKLLPSNKLRVSLLFQNRSSATVFIGIGGDPGSGNATPPPINAIELAAGAVFGLDQYCVFNDIYLCADADGSLVTVLETIKVS